jgi:exodeoxyribonuclease V gamma subunit
MLVTYHSNRLEKLAEHLVSLVQVPVYGSPLAPEFIVVQSTGMARWLSMRLAERLGVCTNIRFPFPAAFLWQLFRSVLRGIPDLSPFDPRVMGWRLMGLFDEVMEQPAFARVRGYLREDDDFRRYELASRIADTFDQYLVYRPDWITRWEAGEGAPTDEAEGWQAALWRRLVGAEPRAHRVRLQQQFFQALARAPGLARQLPPRLFLFGTTSLPPAYAEAFRQLADHTEVHVFLLNPCRQYWGEVLTKSDGERSAGDRDAEVLHLKAGNPLLASLGKAGRDYIDLIQGEAHAEEQDFQETGSRCLLHRVQSDILDLIDRGRGEVPVAELAEGDRTLQVHVCHSPMREVEVLYDQLLALFHAYPDLLPSDIVVMTPDIELYAPYIEAVFGVAEGERRIPYGIADRSLQAESRLVETLFGLLELPASRCDANTLLTTLECPAVRRRFGLSEDDLERVRGWVREVGIRWGRDAESRRELGLPALPEHTWQSGRDRLLLGYALPGEDTRLFTDILPYDDVEGNDAQIMGRFQAFVEAVFALEQGLRGARPVADWMARLQEVIERFFDPSEEEEPERQALREAIVAVADAAGQAGFGTPVPLAIVKSALRGEIDAAERVDHFLDGGVTFSAMVPMRSVPFEVVCLIGLSDGRFPRPQRPVGFDLMARAPRRGDRSRRHEDRYLFLEALLSARRCLYLSYVGQDIRDNSVIPPSVLLSEVLDYLRQGFRGPNGADVLSHVVSRHPLQAFSRRYFSGEEALFSYSEDLCEAAKRAGRGVSEAGPLCRGRLPAPATETRTVELDQLIRFFTHPTRYLLQQRLRVHLEQAEQRLETCEPFILDKKSRRLLRERLLKLHLAGARASELLPLARAWGLLPHGQVGTSLFVRELDAVSGFAERVRAWLPAKPLEPLSMDVRCGPWRLTGMLAGCGREGLVGYRFDMASPRDLLVQWIRHLALNRLSPAGIEPVSGWLSEDKAFRLAPVADADELLRLLLEDYWEGLQEPLHFFVKSAWAYAEAAHKNGKDPLISAYRVWQGSEDYPGEGSDPYYALAFRDSDPLDMRFEALAGNVFLPALAHCTELQR